jgi:hypothetical protein
VIDGGGVMDGHRCRACGERAGHKVLDLGRQPASDYFPRYDDRGPDPVYPLEMWLCSRCGLAQLGDDATVAEEPKGAEPAALVHQAADAIDQVTAAGLLRPGARVAEYGSPHGGSWSGMLLERGLELAGYGEQADVIIDCFGMMHAPDQAAALAGRAARLAPGGVLLLQYHSLETIVRDGQWNALRHGHYAYYSTTALAGMLAACGLRPCAAWRFDLYGGTVLLAACRDSETPPLRAADRVTALLEAEASTGVLDPGVLRGLNRDMQARAAAVHDWLAAQRAEGRPVLGYGAASRAVALLRKAEVDHDLLPAVADASPAKHGLRMPGTLIPIISPAELVGLRPSSVLLFVPDLLAEVRAAYPEVEDAGGRWVVADGLAVV